VPSRALPLRSAAMPQALAAAAATIRTASRPAMIAPSRSCSPSVPPSDATPGSSEAPTAASAPAATPANAARSCDQEGAVASRTNRPSRVTATAPRE
jgi:hypothetical protein